ncbi:MAG: SPOR domain-containing protein [Candidatus Gastranaerophilales bacterium]|nr:SPOR domain-containing protein [Candidatus Gastranaerophilales bacterium]
MKTPDYLSYDRYKKKKKNDKSKNSALIFVTTFFVTLLLFTAVAKSLSPDVDVTIGEDTQTDAKETGLGVKKFIDERLKAIQIDDNSAGVSIKNEPNQRNYKEKTLDEYTQETEEAMELPSEKRKKSALNEQEEEIPLRAVSAPKLANKDLSTPFESPKISKVYVGRYATVEQAKVAQEILLDSGINITPFVKNIGGAYTLQVGSYTNRTKAEDLASELQRNNLPARIVQE